jgi:hypothetical protein
MFKKLRTGKWKCSPYVNAPQIPPSIAFFIIKINNNEYNHRVFRLYNLYYSSNTWRSCGTVALYGPFFLRTIGLRFSLYQKLSKLRKKNLAPLFCQFLSLNRVRERSNIESWRPGCGTWRQCFISSDWQDSFLWLYARTYVWTIVTLFIFTCGSPNLVQTFIILIYKLIPRNKTQLTHSVTFRHFEK